MTSIPLPPCDPPKDAWSGSLMVCERVYRDVTGLYMICGTFTNMELKIDLSAYIDASNALTKNPNANISTIAPVGFLYARISPPGPSSGEWGIWMRCLRFGDVEGGRCVPIVKGKFDAKDESGSMMELSVQSLGNGFKLTRERLDYILKHGSAEVLASYELYASGRFLGAQKVVFRYSTVTQGVPNELRLPNPGPVSEKRDPQ